MTGVEHGPSVIPDADEIQRALEAMRYDRSLVDSPLVAMDAVWDVLLREGVAPNPAGRAWALGMVVRGRHRAVGHFAPPPACAGRPIRRPRGLEADFAAGSVELEVWSALYHRYLDTSRPQVGDLVAAPGHAAPLPRSPARRRPPAARRRARRSEPGGEPPAGRPNRPADRRSRGGPTRRSPRRRQRAARGAPRSGARGRSRRGDGARSALERLATERPADLTAYRLGRLAAWSRPAYRLDTRFVGLTLLVDRGEEAPERWRAESQVYDDLAEVLRAVDSPAVVLLGPPGSRKSTLLRRLELDIAVAELREETDAVPLLVSLGRFGAGDSEAPSPRRWLADLWARRYPDLPPLDALLDEGRLVLLLDGLNEMPHAGFDDYRQRIRAWKLFLRDTAADRPGVRIVFACRSLDYGAPLSSPEQRVPQVRVEPMTDEQVNAFLRRYAPSRADAISRSLRGTSQLDVVQPVLALLAEEAIATGAAPTGRAAPDRLRATGDAAGDRARPSAVPARPAARGAEYRRAVSARPWATAWSLPERGLLVPGLARLAHGMQYLFAAGRTSQVGIDFDSAVALIAHPAAEDVVRAGEALGVLDERQGRDEVVFAHQLIQEYFAARRLAADPAEAASRGRTEDARGRDDPDAGGRHRRAGHATEPLPPPPSTGWDEIVLLAASMAADPAAFVEAVAKVNPPLAGRAAAQPELAERVPPPATAALRRGLIALAADDDIDIRARVEAGLARWGCWAIRGSNDPSVRTAVSATAHGGRARRRPARSATMRVRMARPRRGTGSRWPASRSAASR
ncbi:MAG: NACHT domain-containing protein [Anaerolineae bacterium]